MPSRHKQALLLILLVVPLAAAAPMRPVRAPHAIVVSVHELASRAGVEILKAGGNAVDAAVATGFALAVVHPQAGNLGGGGFMLIRMADGATHFVDYREKAPAAATPNMYLDAQGNVMSDASTIGYKAISVPGSVAGLIHAQRKYGNLSIAKVMAPAIKLAQEGFSLTWEDAEDFQDPGLAKFTDSRRVFQRDGKYFQPGETFRQPELARTLQRISEKADDFYHGQLAREIVAALQKGGCLITTEDLAHYEVKEREPVRGLYRGYEIIGAPPPSSGGIALIEILNILEGYNLSQLGNRSALAMHLVLEAFRRAYFDRAEFLGDPDFSKVPVAQLLDKKYGAAWRESIDPDHASQSKDLHRPAAFTQLEQYSQLQPIHEPEHTTHYAVVDASGNAVAVTTTLNDSFGSRVTVEGLGFLMNDEMDDFSSKPGAPNMFGLVQGPANAVGPGKRPLSSMSPTIVLKDGRLFLVLGSPGGARIISTVANILMDVIDYNFDIQRAVNAPRFHNQWLPEASMVEPGFSPDTLALLRRMGHRIEENGYWSDGECIAIDFKTGERLGASDGRNNGKPVGY